MKHPGQRDVATPLCLGGHFVWNPRYRIGRPDDFELIHWLHRWVSGHCETVQPRDADPLGRPRLRQRARNRNLQVEMLALNHWPVTDALSAPRNDPSGDGKTRDGN